MRALPLLLTAVVVACTGALVACSSTPKQVRPEYLLSKAMVKDPAEVAIVYNAYRTPDAQAAQKKAAKDRPFFKRDTDDERNQIKEVDAALIGINRMDDTNNTGFYPLSNSSNKSLPYLLLTTGIYQVNVMCRYGDLSAQLSTVVLAQKGKTTLVSCTLKDEVRKPVFKVQVTDPQPSAADVLDAPLE